jgi:F-type H+-transporting ATPase subunit b
VIFTRDSRPRGWLSRPSSRLVLRLRAPLTILRGSDPPQYMRKVSLSLMMLLLSASPAMAQEGEKVNLLTPKGGLMLWTLAIFVILMIVLAKFAFKPMLAAVEAREASLQEALDRARTDREEAARLLADHRAQLEAGRTEAQRLIADGRAVSEKMRSDMLDATRLQQAELLDRARRDIDGEKTRAIAELRREAIDLAIAGAGKVIERNLDNEGNRKLVDSFLASLPTSGAKS